MLPLATIFQIAGLAVNLLGVVVPEVDRVVARKEQCCCKTIPERHVHGVGRAQLKVVSNAFLMKDNK